MCQSHGNREHLGSNYFTSRNHERYLHGWHEACRPWPVSLHWQCCPTSCWRHQVSSRCQKVAGGKEKTTDHPAWTVKLLEKYQLKCSIYPLLMTSTIWLEKKTKMNIESEKWWIGRCFFVFFPRGVVSGSMLFLRGCRSLLHPRVHPCGFKSKSFLWSLILLQRS